MGFQDLVTWPTDDGKIPKSVHTGAFLISFKDTFPPSKCKTCEHIFSTFSMDGFLLQVFPTFWSQNWEWLGISETETHPLIWLVAHWKDIKRVDDTVCWYHNSFFGRYLRKYLQLLNELGQLDPVFCGSLKKFSKFLMFIFEKSWCFSIV